MKKWPLIFAVVVIILIALRLIIPNPPPPPARSLVFTILPGVYSNNVQQTCTVLISNASEFPVDISILSTPFYLERAFLSNGVWHNRDGPTHFNGYWQNQDGSTYLDRGDALIAAHGVKKGFAKIPGGATAFKVGLDFTSLTWRGRLGWSAVGTKAGAVFETPLRYLLNQDRRKRSKFEWSDGYPLKPDPATNNSH